ncbi:MAG TPA: tRNA guanosine(34) transglycosylase Tgt [Candidatus Paceibacterota bacterium]|nr:tRNA guanosine(34) transglycosylase Tgt [Candidatus Paceibacterota bacterium]
MRPISLQIEKELPGSLARAGILHTPHGDIETPAFIAVATKADVKGIEAARLAELGVQGIIANTYHLYLSPGEKIVQIGGGVGKFMTFDRPTMTDSGGFQVFSLGVGFGKKISKFLPDESRKAPAKGRDEHDPNSLLQDFSAPAVWDEDLATSHGKLAIVDDEGVSFTSHLDGSLHRFTPERSIEIQHALGADIIFAFDECTAPNAEYEYQKEAMDRTHRWAERSLRAHRQNVEKNAKQGIYGIVQGGRYADLRIESAREIASMDFDGFGIGGSFSKHDLLGILDKVNMELPKEKPRHLLGIGEPEDLFIGAAAGCDTFDCVLPTRNGRTGGLYTHHGKIQIPNAEYKEDQNPIDSECTCPVCARYTKSYIHHLFRTGEMLGPILASQHNLYFLANLARRIRESIIDGSFEKFRDAFLAGYNH